MNAPAYEASSDDEGFETSHLLSLQHLSGWKGFRLSHVYYGLFMHEEGFALFASFTFLLVVIASRLLRFGERQGPRRKLAM